jgi:hypothetical protein
VPANELGVVAQAFFVWNEDIRGYFGSENSAEVHRPVKANAHRAAGRGERNRRERERAR